MTTCSFAMSLDAVAKHVKVLEQAQVFDVWIDPDSPGGPWFGSKRALMTPTVYGLFYQAIGHEGPTYAHYGRFIAVDRARRIEHTRASEGTRGIETAVTITFEPRCVRHRRGVLRCRVLRVATLVEDTEAEGPGRRFALWLQGCPIRCAGCCNPEMFDERGGTERSIDELVARIGPAVEGITLLGGEPFAQATGAAELARAARARGLTVMVFSGYTLDELHRREDAAALLACTDLLVDGRYDRTRPEPTPPIGRRWIGSANQQMHYLTTAYSPGDPRMRGANTIEIRLSRDQLLINGWPSAQQLVRRR